MENVSKDKLSDLELEKLLESVDLNEEVKKTKGSFFEKFKFSVLKLNSTRKEFFEKAPLFSYSLKRILYAFITLYLSIAIVYILLVLFMPDSALVSDYDFGKPTSIKPGSVEYYALIENRKIGYGLSGSLIKQVLIYWRNITPFIPKEVFLPIRINNLVIEGTYEKTWFFLGVIMNKNNGFVNSNVLDEFKGAIPISFLLGGVALLLSYVIGIPLGILSAKYKEKTIDNGIKGFFLGISSIPATVLITMIWIISIKVFGSMGIWGENSYSDFFAIIGVVFLMISIIVVDTRRFVIDEMTSEYTRFAISKGLSSKYVFYVHIFRNAGIRVIKTLPEAFILCLFGSSILVERFWNVPGMSKYILSGVSTNDIYVVLGYIVISSASGVFTSLLSDLLMALLDPRIKLTK
ncbi:oligopeptide ABC transporter permease OppB [Spiroplasma taiwanense]|uniref:Oligopeptide ABC transporter permease n=1 Tax=Spiroplasma taiwanense CT-1 TaxID=1276220 RepID=S5M0E0_9MOLU|nr:oligopeptide ABC transporter permease OppB [Spiroplasma taiwanense]AGR41462.1 oligopeptide ABC transporter permease [Spiroplasma taiwanense CT-1]